MDVGKRVTGLVLAGGKSRRFGSDKATAPFLGTTLLERAVAALEPLVSEVIIVGRTEIPASLASSRCVPDDCPGHGPLGGLYTGLLAMHGDMGITVACDMPLINTALFAHMLAAMETHDVVIPLLDTPEQLHAIYRRTCITPIRRRLEAGQLRMTSFFPDVAVRWVKRSEMEEIEAGATSCINVNTRAEADMVLTLLAARRCETPGLPPLDPAR